ncbi:MAG: hypothetical protein Q4A96_01225, partial [Candidatus Saccharibacteria bacterium]|nr:hypothetical protein [Candidatus Saccharibacteria bacterium]
QKVYLDEKKIHSVQEKLREIQLPKPIKKAFCVVRAGYIIVHTRISKDDIIRHCKNYDELVELIKKFGKNQTSSDSAQKIS